MQRNSENTVVQKNYKEHITRKYPFSIASDVPITKTLENMEKDDMNVEDLEGKKWPPVED